MNRDKKFQIDEINWKIVGKEILYHIYLIFMSALILVMLVQIYAMRTNHASYSSTATLAVTIRSATSNGGLDTLSTSSSIAQVYAETLQDQVMIEKIEEVLGSLPKGTGIQATAIQGMNLITVEVTAKSPKIAYQVITVMMDKYKSITDYIFDNASIEIIKNPRVATKATQQINIKILSILAGILGALGMTLFIFISSIMRPTIKTVQSAERNLESQCIGTVPHIKKNKDMKGLILSDAWVNFSFEESNNQLANLIEHELKKKNKKILMVTSVAENEGKSTVAINLAISLRRRNKRVLIIDLDLSKPAIHKLIQYKFNDRRTLNDYMEGHASLNDILVKDSKSGIYTIMNEHGIEDGHKYILSEKMKELISNIEGLFDYIILDTSPLGGSTDAEFVLSYVDSSILVVRQDCVEISDVNKAIEDLTDGSQSFMGYVLNDFNSSDSSIGRELGN
ncbi:Tyrosine-protein kinase EpsD [Lachnospiraceae bacterium TWA4]|nr:Tyrosine-protein kinase EpsD [Lachnospiraceae bacterium TWA4]